MFNRYQLLSIIRDDARQEFLDDMSADFAKEFKKLTISATDRARAVAAYAKNNMFFDPAVQGLYCNNYTVFCPAGLAKIEGGRGMDIFKIMQEHLKRINHKPVDFYIRESLATGRMIGWKPACGEQYIISIDNNYYSADLVNSCYSMIADNKTDGGVSCALCPFYNDKNYLVMSSRYGSIFILPVNLAHYKPYLDISFNKYMDIQKKEEEARRLTA